MRLDVLKKVELINDAWLRSHHQQGAAEQDD